MIFSNALNNPGVLLIDGDSSTDLGIARSLGRVGIDVYLAGHKKTRTSYSRYIKKCFTFPELESPDSEQLEALIKIAKEFQNPLVIYPTGDTTLRFISSHRQQLEPYFNHFLCEQELIETIQNKSTFSKLAAETGVSVPLTYIPSSLEDLKKNNDLTFPVIVKPQYRDVWTSPKTIEVLKGEVKGKKILTHRELLELYQALPEDSRKIVIQEYIEGPDSNFYSVYAYIDKNYNLVGVSANQKIRIYPRNCGGGTFTKACHEQDVIDFGIDVLSRLKYRGYGMVQLKRRQNGNGFAVFEVNCRFGAGNQVQAESGANFPLAAYQEALGKKPDHIGQPKSKLRWVELECDWDAFRERQETGELTFLAWVKGYIGKNSYCFFALDDLLPWVVETIQILRKRIKGKVNQIFVD